MSKFNKNLPHVELSIDKYKETAYTQAKKGLEVYKHPLDPFEKGRDWLKMQEEEIIDCHQYNVAEQVKRADICAKIRRLVDKPEVLRLLDELEGRK